MSFPVLLPFVIDNVSKKRSWIVIAKFISKLNTKNFLLALCRLFSIFVISDSSFDLTVFEHNPNKISILTSVYSNSVVLSDFTDVLRPVLWKYFWRQELDQQKACWSTLKKKRVPHGVDRLFYQFFIGTFYQSQGLFMEWPSLSVAGCELTQCSACIITV